MRERIKLTSDLKTKMSPSLVELEVKSFQEKCNKAIEMLQTEKPEKVIQWFSKNTSAFSNVDNILKIYKKLTDKKKIELTDKVFDSYLKLSKTMYEITEKSILTNTQYDEILSIRQKKGAIEDTPAPIGKKKMPSKKVSELQNNLLKAHTVYSADNVPEGVSADNNVSIEEFFRNKTLQTGSKFDIRITPKIDGVSITATIIDGVITEALSRGDSSGSSIIYGLHGMRVLEAGKFPTLYVQYEAFMTFSDVMRLSDETLVKYNSIRGAAAGLIHRLQKEENSKLRSYLSFYPIKILSDEKINYTDAYKALHVGAPVALPLIFKDNNIDDILKGIQESHEALMVRRASLGYPIDGIVITILNKEYQKILGRTNRTNNYEIAMKFPPKEAIGIVEGYSLSVGLMGGRNIVIELQNPVTVDDRNFKRISITLADFEDYKLCTGDKVSIVIVGDIIPSIAKVVDRSGNIPLQLPTMCPSCHHQLMMFGGKFYCEYENCEASSIKKIENFMVKIGADGFSEKTAEKLYVAGSTNILKLISNVETRRNTDDKLVRAYDKIFEQLNIIDEITLLKSLGIPKLGESTAKKLLTEYTMTQLLEEDGKVIFDGMTKVSGIGDSIRDIIEKIKENEKTIRSLMKYCIEAIIKKDPIKIATTNLTSEMNDIVREKCKESLNMEYVNSKSFDILVVENEDKKRNGSTSKFKVANNKNKKIITFDEFLELKNQEYDNTILNISEDGNTGRVSHDANSNNTTMHGESLIGFNWNDAM